MYCRHPIVAPGTASSTAHRGISLVSYKAVYGAFCTYLIYGFLRLYSPQTGRPCVREERINLGRERAHPAQQHSTSLPYPANYPYVVNQLMLGPHFGLIPFCARARPWCELRTSEVRAPCLFRFPIFRSKPANGSGRRAAFISKSLSVASLVHRPHDHRKW